jgi:hypothetical protein
MLLAIGDLFSAKRTLEQWARKAAAFMHHKEVKQFQEDGVRLPLPTIQALTLCSPEFAYSGNARKIARATRYRAVVASACRQMVQQELKNTYTPDDHDWPTWISREARRRTLLMICDLEISIACLVGLPQMLELYDLSIPLPCANEIWYAMSEHEWQDRSLRQYIQRGIPLRSNELLAALLRDEELVISTGWDAINHSATALLELINMTRRTVKARRTGRDWIAVFYEEIAWMRGNRRGIQFSWE